MEIRWYTRTPGVLINMPVGCHKSDPLTLYLSDDPFDKGQNKFLSTNEVFHV
jgi:hypothetical protein